MSHNKKSPEDDEALRFENEFLKAKIAAEYGGIHGEVNGDTPPEIENEFLNNIIEFEETMKNANEVLVYDFLGRPDFVNEQDLNDEQLAVELERVNDLLLSKAIVCDIISQVEDRLLYKFLTEELILLTIQDKSIPGMICQFIYEDFHPDHEYDTRSRCEEFLEMFFGDDFHKQIQIFFPKDIRNFAELCEFHDCFHVFRNLEFEIQAAEVIPEKCIRKANVSFDAVTSPGTNPIHYAGEATFELDYKYDWWVVVSAILPGMNTN